MASTPVTSSHEIAKASASLVCNEKSADNYVSLLDTSYLDASTPATRIKVKAEDDANKPRTFLDLLTPAAFSSPNNFTNSFVDDDDFSSSGQIATELKPTTDFSKPTTDFSRTNKNLDYSLSPSPIGKQVTYSENTKLAFSEESVIEDSSKSESIVSAKIATACASMTPTDAHNKILKLISGSNFGSSGKYDKIKEILDDCPLAAAEFDEDKDYLLHYVLGIGEPDEFDFKFVKMVYEAYPDVLSLQNSSKKYPLHWAASLATGDIIEFLCEKYPYAASQFDYKNRLPIDSALTNEHLTVGALKALCVAYPESAIKEVGASGTLLHKIVALDDVNIEAVKTIYELWPEAAAKKSSSGLYPLQEIMQSENTKHLNAASDIAMFLCEKNPQAACESNKKGRYALNSLVLHCHHITAEALLAMHHAFPGAITTTDKDGDYPLHLCFVTENKHSIEFVKGIYELYPDAIKIKNNLKKLPLHYAISNGSDEAIEFLIDKYPEALCEMDYKNRSPLHLTLASNKSITPRILKRLFQANPELLKKKPSPCCKNNHVLITKSPLGAHHQPIIASSPKVDEANEFLSGPKKGPHSWSCCSPDCIYKDASSRDPLLMRYSCPDTCKYDLCGSCYDSNASSEYWSHILCVKYLTVENIDFAYNLCPESISLVSEDGKSLLHRILANSKNYTTSCFEAIKRLLDLNSSLITMTDKNGQFALHVALETVRILRSGIWLSSGVDKCTIDILQHLFSANESVASVRRHSTTGVDENRLFPIEILLALEFKAPKFTLTVFNAYPEVAKLSRKILASALDSQSTSPELIFAILHANRDAVKEDTTDKYSMLHYAIKKGADIEIIKNILEVFPEATIRNVKGISPLITAVSMRNTYDVDFCNSSNNKDEERDESDENKDDKIGGGIFPPLIAIQPGVGESIEAAQGCRRNNNEVKSNGTEGVKIIKQNAPNKFSALLKMLVLADMPINEDGSAKETHGFSWTYILDPSLDIESDNIISDICLSSFEKYKRFAKQLAYAEDRKGRSVFGYVNPEIKKIMLDYTMFLGRYEFSEAVHISATSAVFIGKAISNSAAGSKSDRLVALKFIKLQSQFLREMSSRSGIDAKSIVPILESIDGELEPAYAEAAINRGLSDYSFLIVMPASDRGLDDIIRHEGICCQWERVRIVMYELCIALGRVHASNRIHGDIKPLNIMRGVDGHMQLIDMDASVAIGEACGVKISSAYLPPEMLFESLEDSVKIVISFKNSMNCFLPGEISYDIWALGVILYLLCTGEMLFKCNTEDNLVDEDDKRALFDWNLKLKDSKLCKISNKMARNLVSQLLNKDTSLRPDIAHILKHPFLTGSTTSSRLPGEKPSFDIFISYRVNSDLAVAIALYSSLKDLGFKVWLDKQCIPPGVDWEKEFMKGLADSLVFIPIMSRNAINCDGNSFQNFNLLRETSRCDNVLLEYRLAGELKCRAMLSNIYPVLVGDYDSSSQTYDKYTFRPTNGRPPCHPQFGHSSSPVVVKSVEDKVEDCLDSMGLGSPWEADLTVESITNKLCKYQGGFIEKDLISSLANIGKDVIKMKRDYDRDNVADSFSNSSSASSSSSSSIHFNIYNHYCDHKSDSFPPVSAAQAKAQAEIEIDRLMGLVGEKDKIIGEKNAKIAELLALLG